MRLKALQAVSLIWLGSVCTTTQAQVRFVNCDSHDAFVARAEYKQARSNSPNGKVSSLSYVESAGWSFTGWQRVSPGQVIEVPDGFYYLQLADTAITYANLQKTGGYITSERFSEFVDADSRGEAVKRLSQRNFKFVDFMQFTLGTYRVVGNSPAFELATQRAKFYVSEHRGSHIETIAIGAPIASVLGIELKYRKLLNSVQSKIRGQNVALTFDFDRDFNHSLAGGNVVVQVVVPLKITAKPLVQDGLIPTKLAPLPPPASTTLNALPPLPPPATSQFGAIPPPAAPGPLLAPPIPPQNATNPQLPLPRKEFDTRLGITGIPTPTGVRVESVQGELAMELRLEVGDIVTRIDGSTVRSPQDIIHRLREAAEHNEGRFEIEIRNIRFGFEPNAHEFVRQHAQLHSR
ncbi:MAG: hypothetical protein IT422_06760 [Pirellulaceae bacterium]|nr:hypothetical protein [Pirellulaceae bacterium]